MATASLGPMEGYTRDRLHLESTNPPGHPEPLSRERSGDNSEELLLDRGGRYSGSAEKTASVR